MELSRLREIQDKAAGRQKPNKVRDAYLHSRKDDYEHTDEYYDTERNRSPNIQTMTSDASVTISPPTKNFISMKQKYGHAVLTVSEMMEEELDPLPINTFDCGPIDRTAVTQEEMRKFYNDGPHIGARENDDGTWDMSAAARMATDDDVKHTKEYYTGKDRNRGAMSTSDAEALGD